MKIDLLAPVRLGLGIVALIATLHTALFYPMLYLIIHNEVKVWVKWKR